MNRAERRRLEKQGKKDPTMTIKASELEAMKQKERKSFRRSIASALRASDKGLKGEVRLGNTKASAGFCRRFTGSI